MNIEQLLAHQLYIERLATHAVKNELTPIMQEMYKQVRLSILDSSDSLTSARALKSLKAQIRQIVNAQDFDPLTDGLIDLAKYESEFYADQLELEVDTDSVAKAAAASIMTLQSGKRFDSGLWSDFLKGMQESQAKAINGIVSTGYDRGWTANQMIREVKAQNEGLLRNQAESLVRTGYAHHATVGRRELTRQNKKLIDREIPIVTFDNRTSDTCIGIDSRYKDGWPAGESPIGYPPYHFNAIKKGEMVRTIDGPKKIEDVVAGDMVLTHKGRFKKVLTTMRKRNESDLIRVIRLNTGRVISVTDDHPLLVIGKDWVRADVVEVGDQLFEYKTKDMKSPVGVSVSKRHSYDYPSLFDGDEVFSQVHITSAVVPATVDLYANLPTGQGKVENPILKDYLSSEINKSYGFKVLGQLLLTKGKFFKQLFSMAFNKIVVALFGVQGVVGLHSLRMGLVNFAGFFGHTVGPMIFTNTNAVGNSNSTADFDSFGPAHGFNAMNSTPPAHSSICETKLSLDSPERLFGGKVVGLHEIQEERFISKFEHEISSSVVESISIVGYEGEVYNLEVEEDNTYLVNDVVVHNCRTTVVPLTKGMEITAKRPSIGGKKGEAAKDSFEKRESRLRTKSQVTYRGRKDSNVFDVKQIDADTSYESWLKQQPRWFIEDTLGDTKAKLFIDGKMPLKKFTDMTLRPLTLDELRKRDSEYFKRAGL